MICFHKSLQGEEQMDGTPNQSKLTNAINLLMDGQARNPTGLVSWPGSIEARG